MGNDTLRSPAKGMVEDTAPDPRAERVKRRNERKATKRQHTLRTLVRTDGIAVAAKFFLSGVASPPPSEECEDCLALNRVAA